MSKAAQEDLQSAGEQESNESFDPDESSSFVEAYGMHNRSQMLARRGAGVNSSFSLNILIEVLLNCRRRLCRSFWLDLAFQDPPRKMEQ